MRWVRCDSRGWGWKGCREDGRNKPRRQGQSAHLTHQTPRKWDTALRCDTGCFYVTSLRKYDRKVHPCSLSWQCASHVCAGKSYASKEARFTMKVPGVKDAFQERPIEELHHVNRHGQQVAMRPQPHRRGRVSPFS